MTRHPRRGDDAWDPLPVCGTAPPDEEPVIYVRLYRPSGRGFVGCFWAAADNESIGGFLPVGDVDEGFVGYWDYASAAGKTPGEIVRWWAGKGNGVTYEVTRLLEGTFSDVAVTASDV